MKNASHQVFGACWWCLDRFDWLKIFFLWLNILLQNKHGKMWKKKVHRERERGENWKEGNEIIVG